VYARHTMPDSPHCALELVEMPGPSSTGFNTGRRLDALRTRTPGAAIAARPSVIFAPARARPVSHPSASQAGERSEPRVALLEVGVAQFSPCALSARPRARLYSSQYAARRVRNSARRGAMSSAQISGRPKRGREMRDAHAIVLRLVEGAG
jgi:hypothetical protein